MDKNEGLIGPMLGGLLVALAVGVLSAALLMVLGGWSFMQGAFIGVVVCGLVGAIAIWIMQPLPPLGETTLAATQPEAVAAKPAVKTAAAPAAAASSAPVAAASKPAAKPKPAAAAKKPAAVKKPAATKAAAKPAAAKPAAKAARAPVAADGKPELFTTPQGAADDLKLISGVGPKLEGTLNELGIWHYSQIAALRKKEIEWVDARLRFKGRIERDDWVGQAKVLAKGGETEFSKRKSKS